MNSFEKLVGRLSGESWRAATEGYSPSPAQMEGVIHYLRAISDLARQDERQAAQHVLASPARMLGYVPSVKAANAIEGQATRIADAYAKVLVKNALEWADMVDNGKLHKGLSSDLFEPLLVLLENGCPFRLSKGFFEVGDKSIPVHRWPSLAVG